MNILILLVISVQAIKIPVYKRPAGTDQTIPLNLWNVRRYNWDSQENFHNFCVIFGSQFVLQILQPKKALVTRVCMKKYKWEPISLSLIKDLLSGKTVVYRQRTLKNLNHIYEILITLNVQWSILKKSSQHPVSTWQILPYPLYSKTHFPIKAYVRINYCLIYDLYNIN